MLRVWRKASREIRTVYWGDWRPRKPFWIFVREQYETLIEQLSGVATVTEYGDLNEFLACLKNAMEEELTLDFYTRHGFVTNVALEAAIDTAEI